MTDANRRRLVRLATCLPVLLLIGCASGPPRRVSEPAASVQQLAVAADGGWSVELRIQNFSNVAMRIDSVELALTVGSQAAGALVARPAISIGPESADVVTATLVPSSGARIAVADALARNASIGYGLAGKLGAAAPEGRVRMYDIERSSTLSPVPGLPGVLR